LKKTALISVYDKTGLTDFAKELISLGFEIISTGGTYKHLKDAGIKVTAVKDLTSFPEILGGRVKTLHPKIFAGILSEKDNPSHIKDMEEHSLLNIDLVVVNLYPFKETISKPGVSVAEAIEEIDIGGVSLIRAAAKNFKYVYTLVNPIQYQDFLKNYNDTFNLELSSKLAYEAFSNIADYDVAIQDYFGNLNPNDKSREWIELKGKTHLRYGENPHQKAFLYKDNFDEIFEVLHGKELSYNNILDIDAAINIISEFKDDGPACAIIKHGNPSGIAVSNNLLKAYLDAFSTDKVSAYGGIIIFNGKIDFKTSLEVDKLFTEIILAPDFEDEALELLKKKKNRRLLKFNFFKNAFEFKKINGGVLYQEKDDIVLNQDELKVVTEIHPTKEQLQDMHFAFKVVKHTKSNAVVFVKDKKTVGIGAGQPSRVDSTKIAVMKAKMFNIDLKDSIVASDAYFPFSDGVEELAKAGAIGVIQPGGSVRDDEVIKKADELKLTMVFTGIRHFRH
jgi:phosphoribosylaminoimidazolecarboxamide formyltransferase/IMP cyclohydrolase